MLCFYVVFTAASLNEGLAVNWGGEVINAATWLDDYTAVNWWQRHRAEELSLRRCVTMATSP